MGLLNATFVGYGQQDSHELLQSLLDGLHEDLNRIAKKEYVEDPEIGELTHEEFAKLSWDSYLKRNNSIIVDLFQAQLKNRTECQTCKHESIKFDPYMYLQLPIPETRKVVTQVIAMSFLPQGQSPNHIYFRPRLISLHLKRNASIQQLKLATAEYMHWQGKASKDSSCKCV
jgi:ubiquitin carboxyl-terminal hydrolase 4/11